MSNLFTKPHTRLAYTRFVADVVGKAAKFRLLESWPHALQKSEDIQILLFVQRSKGWVLFTS